MAWGDAVTNSLYKALAALTGSFVSDIPPPVAATIASRADAGARPAMTMPELGMLYGNPPASRRMGMSPVDAAAAIRNFLPSLNSLLFAPGKIPVTFSPAVEAGVKDRVTRNLMAGVYPAISLFDLRTLYANATGGALPVPPRTVAASQPLNTGISLRGMGQQAAQPASPPQQPQQPYQLPQPQWYNQEIKLGNFGIPVWLIGIGAAIWYFRKPAKEAADLSASVAQKALSHARARVEAIPDPVKRRKAAIGTETIKD
jgi:hypothetical protein